MYGKDANEAKYQLSSNKRENSGLNQFKDSKASLEYSNDVDDIYEIELGMHIYQFNTKSITLVIFHLLDNKGFSN